MGIGLLHVKWRPIVTKFGTLIENMSRTGLYDCHIFVTILWEIETWVYEFYKLKSNIDVFLCDVISLLAQVFIVSSNRAFLEVSMEKNSFYGSVFVIWLYFQKAMYRPCDHDIWPMKVIFLVNWVQPYKYPIYISDRYLF